MYELIPTILLEQWLAQADPLAEFQNDSNLNSQHWHLPQLSSVVTGFCHPPEATRRENEQKAELFSPTLLKAIREWWFKIHAHRWRTTAGRMSVIPLSGTNMAPPFLTLVFSHLPRTDVTSKRVRHPTNFACIVSTYIHDAHRTDDGPSSSSSSSSFLAILFAMTIVRNWALMFHRRSTERKKNPFNRVSPLLEDFLLETNANCFSQTSKRNFALQ